MKYLTFLFLILVNSAAWAGKIGIVNLEEVITKSNSYSSVNKTINNLIIKKNAELKLIKDKISQKEKVLNSGVLNVPGKQKITKEIEQLSQQKELFIYQAQKEVDKKEQDLRYPIIKKVLLTIKYISEKENYDLIIEDSTPILEKNVTIHNLNEQVILLLNN